jgi:D-ribose pyranase
MLKNCVLNPHILSLMARVRHTNMLVIADRGFPYWPMIETVDISLIDDIPTVLQIFKALKANFVVGHIFMAEEFKTENPLEVQQLFTYSRDEIPISFKPYDKFKQYVPQVIGLIRTGDTSQYDDIILVST